MALTHQASLRNALAQAVADAVDAGAGPGQIAIITTGITSWIYTASV